MHPCTIAHPHPPTTLALCLQETTQEWRKAEAATVKAEEEAKRAEQLACEADYTAQQAAAAKVLT